ncbi:MAG: fasciclin domain-containing protein [Bacteroidaceae bacterium]|nr:fasciclin domain-containing protein [Bacteroidaceae bacterium]
MKRNQIYRKMRNGGLMVALCGMLFTQQSCLDDIQPGNYYTFTGETVANFLENREDDFSDFIYCLQQANIWGEMRTYGDYTCLAPTNDAFIPYLEMKGVSSVKQLTKEQCDTVAFTHIIKMLMYCTDLNEGSLPYPNMLDRYLTYTADSITDPETGKMKPIYRINKDAIILERDDSVQNGVVHIVDKVVNPSNDFVPDVLKYDDNASLFYQALVETHMMDSIVAYLDEKYVSPSYDSITWSSNGSTGIIYDTGYEHECGIFPEKRYFKYTVFVETDSVFKANGINTLDDLIAYAKTIYDESYPEDKGQYDNDPTDRRNPLNRFVSYHILPEQMAYNQFVASDESLLNNYGGWAQQDVEEFYETLMPYSIMRISYPKSGGRYINRKGFVQDYAGVDVPGVRIWAPSETTVDQTALNGVYHYIDDILTYSKETREVVLNTRIRKFANTLSPDFINSGARGRLFDSNNPSTRFTMSYKPGFADNVIASAETQYWVRYRNNSFSCFFGDEMTIRGMYDVAFRLPPVPFSGTYELRMFECTLAGTNECDRGVVQIYVREGNDETAAWVPCGIPVDLTLDRTDSRVGGASTTDMTDAEIAQLNKSMRNRGYMLPMDSYSDLSNKLLNRTDCLRKIITTTYMYDNQDYWFRIRLVLDKPTAVCPLNVIELVPKSVYAGDIPEDMH